MTEKREPVGLVRTGCETIRVLLVDDDADFRDGLSALLRDDGHEVRDVERPSEIPPNEGLGDVAIMVIDCAIPDVDGLAFADEFHAAHPHVPIVLLTAYGTETIEARAAGRPCVYFARKPLDYNELHARIHDLAGRRPGADGSTHA